jgi:hypothetical protein
MPPFLCLVDLYNFLINRVIKLLENHKELLPFPFSGVCTFVLSERNSDMLGQAFYYNNEFKNMKTKLSLLAEYAKRTAELNIHNGISDGYYKIEEILACDSTGNYTVLRVNASWHPTDRKLTEASYSVTVSLNGLFSRISTGPKEVNPKALLGAVIHVKKVDLQKYEWENKEKVSVKIDWDIISFPEEIAIHLALNK